MKARDVARPPPIAGRAFPKGQFRNHQAHGRLTFVKSMKLSHFTDGHINK
jgi:hypothetical protein